VKERLHRLTKTRRRRQAASMRIRMHMCVCLVLLDHRRRGKEICESHVTSGFHECVEILDRRCGADPNHEYDEVGNPALRLL
jgi:hypothetical protein